MATAIERELKNWRNEMSFLRSLVGLVLTVAVAAGCSTIKVSDRDEYEGPRLPKPARILVYDFAATSADLPEWADERDAYDQAGATMDADQLAAGRKLGAHTAKELVKKINEMGMTAVDAANAPGPQTNDLAIVGYFTSIEKGSGVERVVVGFGKGSAQVNAHVAGYRDTGSGMQRLGGGTIDSGGSGKAPGLILPALVTVATHNPIGLVVSGAVKAEGEVSGRTTDEGSAERIADQVAKDLKPKFHEQGWID
jgi:hypothetical protein